MNHCSCSLGGVVNYPGDKCFACKPSCKCGINKAESKSSYGIIAGYCYLCTPKCEHGRNPNMCCIKTCNITFMMNNCKF
jgi:hypothetical protein